MLKLQSRVETIGKWLCGMEKRLKEEHFDYMRQKSHGDIMQMKRAFSILHSLQYQSKAENRKIWIVHEKKMKREIPMTKRVAQVL